MKSTGQNGTGACAPNKEKPSTAQMWRITTQIVDRNQRRNGFLIERLRIHNFQRSGLDISPIWFGVERSTNGFPLSLSCFFRIERWHPRNSNKPHLPFNQLNFQFEVDPSFHAIWSLKSTQWLK
jgi:hypothetical protein